MGVAVRQSILTSIISYAGVVVGYINLLYLYPKFLEIEEVGLLRTVQDTAMLLVPFATFGLASGVAKFFPKYSKSLDQQNSFVGLIMTMATAGFIVFLLVFMIFRDAALDFFSENAKEVIRFKNLILALTFLLLFTTIFEQLSKAILKVAFPNFLREIGIRVLQGVLVLLYFYEYLTFDQFVLASVLIYVITLGALILFLLRNKIRADFKNLNFFSMPRVMEILKFSSMSFVSVSAMILIGKMDSIMVTGMLGLKAVAVYTTAFYMATVIEIPKRAITQTTATLIARAFEDSNLAEVSNLYRKTALNQFIIGSLLMIGIWANLENIFQFMPKGDEYRAGGLVVILVGLGKLIDMTFGPSSEIIGLSKHYWFNLVNVTALAIVIVICNYVLIPKYGINGAAYGSLFALFVYNAVKFIFIYVKLKMQPFTRETFYVLAISTLVVIMNLLLPRVSNIWLDAFYRSGIITIVFSVLIIASKSSQEVNTLYWKILRQVGLKK